MPHEVDFLLWFYEQYAPYLHKKASEHCANPQDVEDLIQIVWEKLIPKEKVLRGLDKPQHLNYISTTVRNAVREESRKKKLDTCSLETIQWYAPDRLADVEENIDRENRNQLFRKAWTQVDPDIRELLERKFDLEESDAEIAHSMGIKPGSVRMYITRAKRAVRKLFAEQKNYFLR